MLGSWEKVCKSKNKGGIEVKDIEEFNRELLCKWIQRLFKKNMPFGWEYCNTSMVTGKRIFGLRKKNKEDVIYLVEELDQNGKPY